MKPSGYRFEIDWSNPLSKGLVGFYLQGSQVYDVVKQAFVPKSGNAPEVNTSEGTATQYDGTTYFTPPAPNDEFNTDTVTLTLVAADWKTTGRPIHEPIIGKGDNQYAMKGASGALEFFTYRPTTYFDVSYAPTEGQTFIASGTANNDFLRLYVDGVQQDSQADTGAGLIATSAFPLELGRNSQSTGRFCSDQNIVLTCIHNRVLSATEVAELHSNVYQLLKVVPFSADFNFRATAGYVTDGAGETYVIADTYPTLRDGNAFGWTALAQERDRNATNPPELSGVHFVWNNSTDTIFVCDSGAGDFNVRLALGDSVPNEIYAEIVDLDVNNVVQNVLATVSSGTALNANEWVDATGVTRVGTTDWIDNNIALAVSTTQPRIGIRIGDPTNTSTSATSIAHLSIESIPMGELVRSSIDSPSVQTTTSCDLGSLPTAGNLLVFVAYGQSGGELVTTPPTGFDLQHTDNTNFNMSVYTKISDGTEQVVGHTHGNNSNVGAFYAEYSSGGNRLVISSDENTDNVSTINSNSQIAGTLAPVKSENFMVAIASIDAIGAVTSGEAWDSNFTLDASIVSDSSPCAVGSLIGAVGSQSPEWSYTGSADESYGVLLSVVVPTPQPLGAAEINPDHPLAADCSFFMLGSTGQDAVSGEYGSLENGAVLAPTVEGGSIHFPTGAAGSNQNRVAFSTAEIGGGNVTLISRSFSNNTAPFYARLIDGRTGTDGYLVSRFDAKGWYFEVGGSALSTQQIYRDDDRWVSAAHVFDGTNVSVYRDSALLGQETIIAPSATKVNPIVGHNFLNNDHAWNGYMNYVIEFNRVLTEEEIRLVQADPFALVRTPVGTLVQGVETPSGLSSVGTFDVPPTEGNLLIFVANNGLSFASVSSAPAGFTPITSYDGNWKNFWYYKFSDGTETTAQLDWSHAGGYGHYLELYWQKGPASLQTVEDETNVGASNPGPQTTGTLTPDEVGNLCIGQVTASTGNLANQGQVWTGFSPVANIPDQSNPGTSVAVAVDQSGVTSGSLDWSDGSPGSYGALAVFNYSTAPSINILNVQGSENQFSAATTLNYTLPVNADRLVIAHYADYGPQGRDILGATWDGNAATQIQIADDDGVDGRIVSAFIYDVSALGAVTADAVVNLDTAGAAHIICFCLESEGDINYRTPSSALNGSSASISNSITSELGDLVLSFIGWDDQTDAGTTKESGQSTVGFIDQTRGLLGVYSQLAAGTNTLSDFSVPGADSYGSFGVAFYATAPVTALEDVVINFHGGTPASVAGKTINNVQGTTAGQVLSNLLSYDTGADQGFAATVSAAIVASTGGRAVGATTLDQAIFPEGGYVSDPPIPSNYTITLDVPANVTSVDLGIYSATTFGSQVNVDFSANGVSVTGHSSTDNTDGTVVVLAGVVPNASNQIVIDYTGNSSQFIFNNGLRIYNIVTSGGGGGPAQLASDLSGSGTLTANLTVPTDTTLQSSLSGTGTLVANLTLPSDQLACDLSATGTLTANLAGPFVAPVSDTFAGSGALASHWQNFNAAAIPGVERVAGYLEGDITDNTSDVTTWLDDLRGRLDYQDAKVPDSGTEEYILTNVGVGPVADPRANLPYTSQLAFAGIVIHNDNLGTPGVAADANYEFLVVGHRGGSQQATLEWKATNAGTSSVGHEGANTLGTNITHADVAVEINSIGEARFKYRAANSSDPWIYINGGSGRTFAPIAWGASGSRFKIGIIGYTLGSSAIPFTYSVDAFSAPSTSVVSNLNGTGTLTANLTIPADTLQSDLNATGTIAANLTIPADTLQSNLNATGILTANLTVPADNLQSDLSATGTLTANLTIPADTLQSVLNGSGTLTANLVIPTDTLQSDLNATGILTANLTVPADQLSASLNGFGNLSANLTIPGDPLASDLSGTGTLTADLTVSTGALLRVDLVGNGNLVANMVVPADTLQADLVGTGRLIANLNGEDSPIIVIELTGEYIPVIEITSREDTIFYSGNDLNLSVAVIDDSTGQELNVSSIINARYALESCDGTLSISKELGNGISVDTETNRVIISMDRSDTIDRSGRHYHHELAIQTATGFSTVFESEVLIKDSLFDA